MLEVPLRIKASILYLVLFLSLSWAQENLPMIAVNDFVADGLQPSEARILTDRLRGELLNTKTFRVMERSQMDAILAEQGFQQSGACNNDQCQVQVGQLLAVDRLVVGQVGKFGEMYTVSARIINVSSGEVVATAAVDHEGRLEGLLKERMFELAQKLVGNPAPIATTPAPTVATSTPPAPIPAPAQLAQEPAPSKAPVEAQVQRPPTKSRMPLYIVRGLLLVGAVGGGVAGYLLDQDAEDMAKDYHPISTSQARQYQDDISSAETLRNIAFIAAGVLAVGGAVTFAF